MGEVVQLSSSLQKLQLTGTDKLSETTNEISIYKDVAIDQATFAHGIKDLKLAFPKLKPGWYDLLKRQVKEKGFTNKRFYDAVNYVIGNCIYPEPTIAQILRYDRIVKSFTYNEILELNNKNPGSMENYIRLQSGKWVKKTDAEKFNLE